MSKTNTIVASDSSTSDDMRELEIAWVCCAREGLKPHYHTFFLFCADKNSWKSITGALYVSESTSWTRSELPDMIYDSQNMIGVNNKDKLPVTLCVYVQKTWTVLGEMHFNSQRSFCLARIFGSTSDKAVWEWIKRVYDALTFIVYCLPVTP